MHPLILAVVAVLGFVMPAWAQQPRELLNVSYDPTREFYQEYNQLFAAYWKDLKSEAITIQQSHGGSGKQARAVIDGLEASVVTLALAYDIDMIAAQTGKIPVDWQKRLPNNSSPYTSTVVFLVRKGNPKRINDWADLVRDDVSVITPNPKTSGGARWNYLAAWVYALGANGGSEEKAQAFMGELFKHVPVLDTGARGATTTFAQRHIGDVLITWENEAHLAIQELGAQKFDIIMPSVSMLAEPPVALVDGNAERKQVQDVASAYLQYLYSKPAQELAAKYYFRPSDPEVLAKNAALFPAIPMKTITELGGWAAVQKKHFDDKALFDQIYEKKSE